MERLEESGARGTRFVPDWLACAWLSQDAAASYEELKLVELPAFSRDGEALSPEASRQLMDRIVRASNE